MSDPAVILPSGAAAAARQSGPRPWLVFAVSFGLLLSDYMSRQVLAAVFPLLKAEWTLSDSQLGALGGVVALMVGLLTVPLSLVADRVGRARSVAVMAFTWSLATLGCGLCASYGQLLAARLVLGVGEAAYGSVGLAVVFTYFPARLRGTITSAFMAGGLFGSFLGLSLGGVLAASVGWRGAFAVMAALGLGLASAYVAFVRDRRGGGASTAAAPEPAPRLADAVRSLVASRAVVLTYLASGAQLFTLGAFTAWAPSYLNRAYGLAPAKAAALAAVLLLASGVGMIACGALSDRLTVQRPARRSAVAAVYGLLACAGLEAAFALPPGPLQVAAALVGLFFAGGTTGPAGAVVAARTPPALHGAALAVLTLANNLIGLAPGPAVTGVLADRLGLAPALQIAAAAPLLAAGLFWLSGRDRSPT